MTQLILNDEQARILSQALEPVELLDNKGNVLRTVPPIWTAEDIAEAKRRIASGQPGLTTAQVLAQLRSLEST